MAITNMAELVAAERAVNAAKDLLRGEVDRFLFRWTSSARAIQLQLAARLPDPCALHDADRISGLGEMALAGLLDIVNRADGQVSVTLTARGRLLLAQCDIALANAAARAERGA